MKKNVGQTDSYIRFMIGIAFLLNIIILDPAAIGTIVLLVLGVVFLATAFTRYCGLYTLFGVCTCEDGTCSEEPAE